jgi:hypothetical protein
MRQRSVMLLGAVALCIAVSAGSAAACDEHKAKASAQATSDVKMKSGCATSTTMQVSMTSGSGCAAKGSMASLLKQAPGTKSEFVTVDNGVALVVTASKEEYVSVVQNALIQRVDDMKMMTEKASLGGAHCATKTASAEKVSGSHCAAKTTEQASVVKTSGAGCCATKGASAKASTEKASVSTVSAESCPEWMQVLCGSNCTVTKTSTGVMITWTSEKKEMLDQLRVAGEKFHADLAQL